MLNAIEISVAGDTPLKYIMPYRSKSIYCDVSILSRDCPLIKSVLLDNYSQIINHQMNAELLSCSFE